MQTVEMTVSFAGRSVFTPDGKAPVSGQLLNLPDDVAEAWLAEGYCKRVTRKEQESK